MRDATDRMVVTLRLRQMQKDVNKPEEAELRRLENGATAGGDGDRPVWPQTGGGHSGGDDGGDEQQDGGVGVVVVGAKQRADQLYCKKFVIGGFRYSHKVGIGPDFLHFLFFILFFSSDGERKNLENVQLCRIKNEKWPTGRGKKIKTKQK